MNHRIGYAQSFTEDQHLHLQSDALRKAGCRVIYEEAAGGKNVARLKLDQYWKGLRSGDTLVVWRLNHLGRRGPKLVQIVANWSVWASNVARRYSVSRTTLRKPLEVIKPQRKSNLWKQEQPYD